MIGWILHMLCLAGVIAGISFLLPGIKVDNFGSALKVAVVYGILNWLFYTFLFWLALPFAIITLGLAIFFFNAFLLWITDKLLEDFEIDNLLMTLLAAGIITIANSILGFVFGR